IPNGRWYTHPHGYSQSNCYAYADGDPNSDSHVHTDGYRNGYCHTNNHIYSYANGYCKCYSNGHTHLDAETVANGTTWTIDKAASHASAKAVVPCSRGRGPRPASPRKQKGQKRREDARALPKSRCRGTKKNQHLRWDFAGSAL